MRQIESFFWGIVAALGALFVQLLIFIANGFFQVPGKEISFSQFFAIPVFVVLAALVEEIFKYLVIAKRVELFSLAKSYMVNSWFVGAGFFAIELLLMTNSGYLPEARMLVEIAIIHLGTCGIMGYLIALKNPGKIGTFLQVLALATLFHAGYNFLILTEGFLQTYFIYGILALLILLNLRNLLVISKKLASE